MLERTLHMLGIERHPVSHVERWVSIAGAFVGIFFVFLVSRYFLSGAGVLLVVASLGASAVLLFAVPHGALSQPWPLVGGHLVSAVMGVTCARYISDGFWAAPLAVALAVGAMHYLRCIHPPGGATALTAVAGGPQIQALGYGFVITPVLINVAAILASAIVFNWFFHWRSYPAYLDRFRNKKKAAKSEDSAYQSITHEDFVYALSEIDSFIDVNEEDLLKIYDLATRNRDSRHLDPAALKPGSCYSNGKYGKEWSVRQIIDRSEEEDPEKASLIYKGIAGAGRRSTGVASPAEFARWAKYEVYRDEENWRRVSGDRSNPYDANHEPHRFAQSGD